ncbi:acyl-CoA dehydrogenase family protein, partial [Acinetobacter sp.]|uniref:acyl-CoA dehydrogenase family protein n=1 Tax=Acinetobacter sp. TaxID=472 RepID=UPI0031DA9EBC
MTSQSNQNLSLGAHYEQVAGKFRPIFKRIAEGALAREKNRTLPYEPIQWLKQAGFGAVRVPVAFGGDGVSQKQLFQLLIELAQADSNVVQALRGHFAFVEDRLNAQKTAAQTLWFERFVRGEIVGNAWTEIGQVEIGDVATRVTAVQDGKLRINGQKYYSTGTIFADWIDLFALDEST